MKFVTDGTDEKEIIPNILWKDFDFFENHILLAPTAEQINSFWFSWILAYSLLYHFLLKWCF